MFCTWWLKFANYLFQVLLAFTYHAFIILVLNLSSSMVYCYPDYFMSSYLISWTPIEEVVVVVGVDDAQTGRSVRVWRCVKFKDITATEWPGRVPGREVCVLICVSASCRVPDQLISAPLPLILTPPRRPSSRAALCYGQIPTFFNPSLNIKCPAVPCPPPHPPVPFLYMVCIAFSLTHKHSVIFLAHYSHCSLQTDVTQ